MNGTLDSEEDEDDDDDEKDDGSLPTGSFLCPVNFSSTLT